MGQNYRLGKCYFSAILGLSLMMMPQNHLNIEFDESVVRQMNKPDLLFRSLAMELSFLNLIFSGMWSELRLHATLSIATFPLYAFLSDRLLNLGASALGSNHRLSLVLAIIGGATYLLSIRYIFASTFHTPQIKDAYGVFDTIGKLRGITPTPTRNAHISDEYHSADKSGDEAVLLIGGLKRIILSVRRAIHKRRQALIYVRVFGIASTLFAVIASVQELKIIFEIG